MFGEIIIFESEDITSVVLEEFPSSTRESKTWKQINEFHFSGLWEILVDEKGSGKFDSEISVVTAPNGDSWAFIIPKELVLLISECTGKGNVEVVEAWSEIEEFKWGWKPKDINSLFFDLVSLANGAKAAGRNLIYWGRL